MQVSTHRRAQTIEIVHDNFEIDTSTKPWYRVLSYWELLKN